MSLAGSTISHFEVVRPLGKGGMGEVYLARDTRLGRLVALKTFDRDDADRQTRVGVLREAQLASAVTHPNIAHVYEAGEDGSVAWIAMEYVEGRTLADVFATKPLPSGFIVDIALQIAEALSEAHRRGVVHRDVKPSNVVVTERGHVKVLDFGLAKALNSEMSVTSLSSGGCVVGTVAYMSPEQALGNEIDGRSDIFSFGVLLYETVTRQLPFSGRTAVQTLTQILHEDPPPVRQIDPSTPPGLQQIIERCLEKSPEDRYATADELARDLRKLSTDISAGFAKRKWLRPRTRRIGAAAFLAAAVVLAVAAGAMTIRRLVGVPRVAETTSLAIMPFASVGAQEDTEYLSDGLTETLINRMSRIANLRVVSRPTVFSYKDKPYTPQQIGRDLDVQRVLTGRVTRKGDTVEVQAELIDTRTDQQLWGERYAAPAGQLLTVQDQLQRTVLQQLDVRLTRPQQMVAAATMSRNPAAYQAYLRGKYLANKSGSKNARKAIEYYRTALQEDPGFALAQAGLAEAYIKLVNSRGIDAREGYRIAAIEIERALRMDPLSAEVHTIVADVHGYYHFDWAAADRHFRRAIELNPSYVTAHYWYGLYLTHVGRFDEALRENAIAQKLDPASPRYISSAARTLWFARRYRESEQEIRKAIDLNPKSWSAWDTLALALYAQGRYDEWFEAFRNYQEYKGREDLVPVIEKAWKEGGERAVRRAMLADSEKRAAAGRKPNLSDWAVACVRAGEYDRAFDTLEMLHEQRSPDLVRLRSSPVFDPLRSDPRYWSLVQRANLPEPQVSDRPARPAVLRAGRAATPASGQ